MSGVDACYFISGGFRTLLQACRSTSYFCPLFPACSPGTLSLLGISVPELTELCTACTGFIRYVVDQVRGREGEGGAVVPEEGGTTAPKGGGGPD